MASANPLHPLELNAATGEPYLRLPPPHAHIILTPARASDAPALVALLNDPAIYLKFAHMPHPYTLHAHAAPWAARRAAESAAIVRALTRPDPPRWADGCPVHVLREERAGGGGDALIGDVWLVRYGEMALVAPGAPGAFVPLASDAAARMKAANAALPAGDPALVWSFGDWIAPAHHGRGIATAAVRALLHGWAVPRMGARRIAVNAFTSNAASARVFVKNGFVLRGCAADCIAVRGEWRSLQILEWTLPPDGEPGAEPAEDADADPDCARPA